MVREMEEALQHQENKNMWRIRSIWRNSRGRKDSLKIVMACK